MIPDQEQHGQHDAVVNNVADNTLTTDELHCNNIITLVDDDSAIPLPPEPSVLAIPNEEEEEVVNKPSFIDILNINPNLQFQNRKKTKINKPVKSCNSNNRNVSINSISIADILLRVRARSAESIVNNRPSDVENRAAAEKRVCEAKSAKDAIQQRLDLKQADCDEAKRGFDLAVLNNEALNVLIEPKNVELSEAESELMRFKSSGGGVENVLQNKDLVLLADDLASINALLRAYGVGVQDLEWTELADELLRPLKIEVFLLKESVRRIEVITKACKKNYDSRIGELEVLKAQFKEAEGVFEEVNRELLRLQNKDITKENEQIEDASDPTYNGKMDLNNQVNEICKQDAGNICIDQTKVSDKTSEPAEVGCNSCEGLNLKEVHDAGESDLVVKIMEELSKTKQVEEDTNNDEIRNGTAMTSTEPQQIKKPNKRERRALAKAAALLAAAKEKATEDHVCVEQTELVHTDSEQAAVSEQVLKLNSEDNEDELEKVERIETEIGEEDEEERILDDDDGNYSNESEIEEEEECEEKGNDENYKYPSKKTYRNKKKQKKLARKLRKARAAELRALEGNGNGDGGMRFLTRMKMMAFVIGFTMLLVMLWYVLLNLSCAGFI